MASRVLGFVRDILIANLLGSGPVAEAFFVAFRLPNMFRRFFAEGAFNMAFIPLFSKRLEGEGAADAHRFAGEAFSGLLSVLILLTVVAQAAMPWFVLALASGFDDAAKFDLAVTFSRIVFPYIVFISLAALLSGVLNAYGRFAAAAAAPVLLNIILISALGGAALYGLDSGFALAWGACLAGIAQFALLWHAARRLPDPLPIPRPRWTPEMRRLVVLGLPAAMAGGVMQINLVVGTQVASYFDGAVVWLWMADRIYQLPLGVVGIAIGVVLLPELSRRVRAGDRSGGRESMNRAGEFTLVLTLPATIALIMIPAPLVDGLYQHGAFTEADSRATALALAIYGAGLPAFVLQKIVQPAFFAREDTRTPLRFALVSMLVNFAVAVGLAPVIGFSAAALGATLAGWVNLLLLWRAVRGLDPELHIDTRLSDRIPRVIAASAGMGVGLWVAQRGLSEVTTQPQIVTAVLVVFGVALYAALGVGLKAFRLEEVRAALRRRSGKTP